MPLGRKGDDALLLHRLETLENHVLNERIYGAIVEGLTVFVLPKKGFQRKYAEISVNYGSNDNEFIPHGSQDPVRVPPGIAHFLEHKMFEKSWGEAFTAFGGIGASANAFTTNNSTSYLFWTIENFQKSLDLLVEVVFSPHFTDKSVEKEKGIISQEIKMYEDQPVSRLYSETLSAMYLKHPVRIDIAGTEDSIQQITKDLLYLCHSNFYTPSNATLFIAGDFDPEEAFDAAQKSMARLDLKGGKSAMGISSQEPARVGDNVRLSMPVPTPLLQVGWKDSNSLKGRDLVLRELAASLVLEIVFGTSSPFFSKIYKEGLTDDLSFSYEAWPGYAFAAVAAESDEPERLVDMILQEADLVREKGVDRDEFERKKKSATGRFVTLFNSFDAVARTQVHLARAGLDIFTYGEMLHSLNMDDLLACSDILNSTNGVNVVIKEGAT